MSSIRDYILENLAWLVQHIINILVSMRRVNYGDYVLADDVSKMIDIVNQIIQYNDNLIDLLQDLGIDVPQDVLELRDTIKIRASGLHKPQTGEIVDADQWLTITLILRDEYQLLTNILSLQDIAIANEQITITETATKQIQTLYTWPMFHHDRKRTGRTQANNTIYIGSDDNYVYALNPDGTLKWRYQTGDIVFSSPAIDSDGVIYIGSEDNYVYALNPDGTLKWSYKTGDWVDSSPAVADDGTIYVGSNDGYLYALNPDGTLKWRYQTGNKVDSSPAVV